MMNKGGIVNKASGKISLISVLLLILVSIGYRTYYSYYEDKSKVTTWDALGYYMYLPAYFIYDDYTELNWFEAKEAEYNLTGGNLYQFRELDNGHRPGMYFVGISIMESPFFGLGHVIAGMTGYEQDGFSLPYQICLSYGVLVYFALALFLLRKILLRYYDDLVVTLTLLILVLGTNLLQYVSMDGLLSHSFIFLLYVLLLHFTISWHEKPTTITAALIGFIIGFAMLCRPTEALMVFIPVLWNVHDKTNRKAKWELILRHKNHIVVACILGAVALLPQLIYWKVVTGSWVYNVGSKWTFLNPWFRILFGFEKGWFIYTPLTVLIVGGLFLLKGKPFKNAVVWFSILNIWLIISWYDWRYGGSYSTRALVQSYPVLALALAAVVAKLLEYKVKLLILPVIGYLIFVNLFQLFQYNTGVLVTDGMNRPYYAAIYLKPEPSPLDMSLLDTDETINPAEFNTKVLLQNKDMSVKSFSDSDYVFLEKLFPKTENDVWIRVQTKAHVKNGLSDSYLACDFVTGDTIKTTRIRLNRPLIKLNESNEYDFFFRMPCSQESGIFRVYINTKSYFHGELGSVRILQVVG